MKFFLIKSKFTVILGACLLTPFSDLSFAEEEVVERVFQISMAQTRNSSDSRSRLYIRYHKRRVSIIGKNLASDKGTWSGSCNTNDPQMMALLRAVDSRDTLGFEITDGKRCINIIRVRASDSVTKERY